MPGRLPVPVPGTPAGRGEVRTLDSVTGQSGEPGEHNRSGVFPSGCAQHGRARGANIREHIAGVTITADEHETGRAYRLASLCHSKAAFGGGLLAAPSSPAFSRYDERRPDHYRSTEH